jgi:hypothetical protein
MLTFKCAVMGFIIIKPITAHYCKMLRILVPRKESRALQFPFTIGVEKMHAVEA